MKPFLFLAFVAVSLFANELDDRIDRLQKEIKELRIKAMQEEVGSSTNFRSDYKEFAEDIEKAESYEDQVEKKEKELQALLRQRESR